MTIRLACQLVRASAGSWLAGLLVWAVVGLVSPEQSAGRPIDEKPDASFAASLGIKMVEIKPGSFTMGSTPEQIAALVQLDPEIDAEEFANEQPPHRVEITKPFRLSAHEVTVGQFRAFVNDTNYQTDAEINGVGGTAFDPAAGKVEQKPGYTWKNVAYEQTENHPVVNVSWDDAVAFCSWLTRKEGQEAVYRLPTEAEWEYACRAGSNTLFPDGDDPEDLVRIANVYDDAAAHSLPKWKTPLRASDGHVFAAPVGSYAANTWGLYDMIGNVREWCLDGYEGDYYQQSPAEDPSGPTHQTTAHVVRGGSWGNNFQYCRPGNRRSRRPRSPMHIQGFRIVRAPARDDVKNSPIAGSLGQPSANPSEKQGRPIAQSLGIKMVEIKPGSFLMGSTDRQISTLLRLYPEEKPENFDNEQPLHRVKISKPFSLSAHEITVGQFRQFVNETNYKTEAETDGQGGHGYDDTTGQFEQKPEYSWKNPGYSQKDNHPVVNVSWDDAVAFCSWLTRKEGQDSLYRLPTEAEWEYACRAGTDTLYPGGNDPEDLVRIANVLDGAAQKEFPGVDSINATDGFVFTAPVGSLEPNPWGLYDVIGNVWEWCLDGYEDSYAQQSPAREPFGARPARDPLGSSNSMAVRVIRGGGWFSDGVACRPAGRSPNVAQRRGDFLGFRVARVVVEK